MNLSTILSEITIVEVQLARSRAAQMSHTGKPFNKHRTRIIQMYPAAETLMTLGSRADHELFTKKKISGYSSACCLLANLADICAGDALSLALASITDEEMLSVVEEILSTDKMSFAQWFLTCGEKYYGYAAGMWKEFLFLLESGKNEQSIGHLIIAGGLIIIAEKRDALMALGETPGASRFPFWQLGNSAAREIRRYFPA